MIVEWLISVGAAISEWFAGLFPTDAPPAFVTEFGSLMTTLLDNLDGVAVWADWIFVLGVVSAVLGVWVTGVLIKFIRAVAAHIPFFGGAG